MNGGAWEEWKLKSKKVKKVEEVEQAKFKSKAKTQKSKVQVKS